MQCATHVDIARAQVLGYFAAEDSGFDAGLMAEAVSEGVAAEVALAQYCIERA